MAVGAYQRALQLLARRDHFAAELKEKLTRKGHLADEIDEALTRCVDLGLVNDEKLAERFAQLRSADRGWGPHRILAELRKRGVEPSVAGSAARLSSEAMAIALNRALVKVERRAKDKWWSLPEARARMISSLIGRGFDTSEARDAVFDLAALREKTNDAIDDQPGDS
ncbi:MAG: regulatory protein RecX [bacterium]|nr:regulatory protein RecX [bacterium]